MRFAPTSARAGCRTNSRTGSGRSPSGIRPRASGRRHRRPRRGGRDRPRRRRRHRPGGPRPAGAAGVDRLVVALRGPAAGVRPPDDVDMLLTGWLDARRADPGGVRTARAGAGDVITRLRDPATDRSVREPRGGGAAAPHRVVVDGPFLLAAGLPLDGLVHLRLSPAALSRALPADRAWWLDGFERYAPSTRPRTAPTPSSRSTTRDARRSPGCPPPAERRRPRRPARRRRTGHVIVMSLTDLR